MLGLGLGVPHTIGRRSITGNVVEEFFLMENDDFTIAENDNFFVTELSNNG